LILLYYLIPLIDRDKYQTGKPADTRSKLTLTFENCSRVSSKSPPIKGRPDTLTVQIKTTNCKEQTPPLRGGALYSHQEKYQCSILLPAAVLAGQRAANYRGLNPGVNPFLSASDKQCFSASASHAGMAGIYILRMGGTGLLPLDRFILFPVRIHRITQRRSIIHVPELWRGLPYSVHRYRTRTGSARRGPVCSPAHGAPAGHIRGHDMRRRQKQSHGQNHPSCPDCESFHVMLPLSF